MERKTANRLGFILVGALAVFIIFGVTWRSFQHSAHNGAAPLEKPVREVAKSPDLPKSPESPLDMVQLDQNIPNLLIDLRYAGSDNVFKKAVYSPDLKALLRRGSMEKLKKASEEFAKLGYRLKIWDAYRPPAVEFELWEIMPDQRFVVNPYKGFSHHSRGVAVDVTLVDSTGKELLMPSGFDEFNLKADRDYKDVSPEAAKNSRILEDVMRKNGFKSIPTEWWHFSDSQARSYPVWNDKQQNQYTSGQVSLSDLGD